nr:iron-siderophore ABC transporter substrate-binding protein [Photobacterium sanctipauli]
MALVSCWAQAQTFKHELGEVTFDKTPQRVVALDWVLTEAVLSLGVTPVGIADVSGYQTWVSEPVLSDDVINVGSRREPNLELLAELKPDVILMSEHMAAAYRPLQRIAPVMVYSAYSNDKTPLESATLMTTQLGKLLDKEQQAQQVIAQTNDKLANNGEMVRKHVSDVKPLMFVRFINDKTLRIHGEGSLADDTITKMGLVNDWSANTNLWGFTTAGFEKLAEHQQTNLMIFGPLTEAEKGNLTKSLLWQAMAFTREDTVYELPAIWTFGGLISAQRFSDHITQQLINTHEQF